METQGKKRGFIKVIAIVLVLAALIVVSSFFSDGPDGDFFVSIPKIPASEKKPNDDDFFEIPEESQPTPKTSKQREMPRAEVGTGVSLPLTPLPDDTEALSRQEVYKKCSPYVVAIEAQASVRNTYWGTGIIMSADGYILTNSHVIADTYSVTVILEDERRFEAKLVGHDAQSDIAVLKIDAKNLPYAEFGDSSEIEVGDEVVAIGNPLGSELRGTFTNGVVSGVNRDVDYEGYTMSLIQTNAAINEGNSGGPLINMHGQVIGITNMKMVSTFSSIEGIGFAIPTATMKDVVDELIELGAIYGRPVIGITVQMFYPEDVDSDLDSEYVIYVISVEKNSNAYKKGVRQGDIITEVNGIEVFYSSDITEIKNEYKAGDEMTFTIYRDGEFLEITFNLDDYSEFYG